MPAPPRIVPSRWDARLLRRYTAPESLRLRVLDKVDAQLARDGLIERLRSMFAPRWPALGAGFAAGALAGALALNAPFAVSSADPVAREVVSNHVRSLMAEHLSDVASSDSDTVRSWFRGRIDYAPRVADLSSLGYALVGGRLDYVADRPVAALVYARAQHVVNVFACPLQGRDGNSTRMARHGFHATSWTDSAMQYWVVADLDAGELERFAAALRESKRD